MPVDLKKEQEATLARPRMRYGFMASFLFAGIFGLWQKDNLSEGEIS